jgi:hypothetical protein
MWKTEKGRVFVDFHMHGCAMKRGCDFALDPMQAMLPWTTVFVYLLQRRRSPPSFPANTEKKMHDATILLTGSFILIILYYLSAGPKIKRNGQSLK